MSSLDCYSRNRRHSQHHGQDRTLNRTTIASDNGIFVFYNRRCAFSGEWSEGAFSGRHLTTGASSVLPLNYPRISSQSRFLYYWTAKPRNPQASCRDSNQQPYRYTLESGKRRIRYGGPFSYGTDNHRRDCYGYRHGSKNFARPCLKCCPCRQRVRFNPTAFRPRSDSLPQIGFRKVGRVVIPD